MKNSFLFTVIAIFSVNFAEAQNIKNSPHTFKNSFKVDLTDRYEAANIDAVDLRADSLFQIAIADTVGSKGSFTIKPYSVKIVGMGLGLPKGTTAARKTLITAMGDSVGVVYFNTDSSKAQINNGTVWKSLW